MCVALLFEIVGVHTPTHTHTHTIHTIVLIRILVSRLLISVVVVVVVVEHSLPQLPRDATAMISEIQLSPAHPPPSAS